MIIMLTCIESHSLHMRIKQWIRNIVGRKLQVIGALYDWVIGRVEEHSGAI